MAEAALACSHWRPTAERCPACTMGRLAMACKVAAVGRTDRNRWLRTGRRPVGTTRRRTGQAGTGRMSAGIETARKRTDSCRRLRAVDVAADRLRARSDRLCCPPQCRSALS